jgi:glycosyltransferase involved in cell wall biosynthesis
MGEPAFVSVVIPTYNRAYCLARAIDSALAQSHARVEVLVIDDGSTDGTGELVRGRYAGDGRVRYFRQTNAGVVAARNAGLNAVRGDFVALLDSDDEWYPWKLQAQLAALRFLPHAGMVWTDMEAVDPNGRVLDPRHLRTMYKAYRWWRSEDLFPERYPLEAVAPGLGRLASGASAYAGDIFSQMVMGNLVHTSTVLLRRERLEAVGRFNPALGPSGEDYDFHLRTCRARPVAFVDLAAIRYQKGFADHLSRPHYGLVMARNFLKTISPVLERDGPRIRLPRWMIREVLAEAHAWVSWAAAEKGERGPALQHGLQSLWYKPWQRSLASPLVRSLLPSGCVKVLREVLRAKKKGGAAENGTAGSTGAQARYPEIPAAARSPEAQATPS